jgi:hypothetical protein
MVRTWFRISFTIVIFVTITATLGPASEAQAWTRRTPSVPPQPNGYLRCHVLATSKRRIGIVTTIQTTARVDVTEFGYGSRERTPEGLFKAEETAGSFDRASDGYKCKVAISGAHRKDVAVSLISADGDDVTTGTGTAR